MELGEKLRLTRLEAGLSQRALCGDEITRNMLSRIENGAARPSMKTLGCLAARLGKPVSYFLEEDTVCSPNQEIMTAVRQLFDGKDYAGAMQALAQYRAPDEIYDRERQLLEILVRLHLAEEAIGDGREPYALELLEAVAALGKDAAYYSEDLEQRRLLLLGRIPGQVVNLPGLDEALTVQAASAFAGGDVQRAAHLLDGAEDRTAPCWNILRGKCHMAMEEFPEAAKCFLAAEGAVQRPPGAGDLLPGNGRLQKRLHLCLPSEGRTITKKRRAAEEIPCGTAFSMILRFFHDPEVPDLSLDLLVAPQLFGIDHAVGVIDLKFAVLHAPQNNVVTRGGEIPLPHGADDGLARFQRVHHLFLDQRNFRGFQPPAPRCPR